MGFKIAEAFVEVTADGRKVAKTLADDMESSADGTRAGMGFGAKLLGGIAALGIGAAVGGFLKGALVGASDLNETMSKSNAIFGDNAAEMVDWSKTAKKTLGLSSAAALDAASGFGDMFSQIGFTGSAAAKMSKSVVKAAADLGSFSNLDTADVAERMSAAFRGEYDSLQKVIPNISAARVESEAMAATGKKLATELTAADKATAVLAIVTKDGARAMGDFERTSGGFANQLKITKAGSEELRTSFGQALLPAAVAVATAFNNQMLPALQGFVDKSVPAIATGVPVITGWLATLGTFVGDLFGKIQASDLGQAIAGSWPWVLEIGGKLAAIFNETLWPAIESIAGSLGRAGDATGLGTWQLFQGGIEALIPFIQSLSGFLGEVAKLMADNPALVDGVLASYVLFRVGLGLTTGAQWLLNAAVSANPYVIAIVGIIAVIGYLVWLTQNFDRAKQGVADAAQGIVSFLGMVSGAIGRWAAGGLAAVLDFVLGFRRLPIQIGDALRSAVGLVTGVGGDIMAGLVSGLVAGLSRALATVRKIASDIVSAAKNALGIHSPSRVFADEVGAQIPAGIEAGALDGSVSLNRTIRNLVKVPPVPGGLGSGSGSGSGGGTPVIIEKVIIDASNVEDFARVVKIFQELGQTVRAGRNLQIG